MSKDSANRRRSVLFICGSINQTTQMAAIAGCLPDWDCWFSPFYAGDFLHLMRRMGAVENTIGGQKLGNRCLAYLESRGLQVDFRGKRGRYDLYVNCTDLVLPPRLNGAPMLIVQEGIMDPDGLLFEVVRRFPRHLPRWIAGTSGTGLSGGFDRFCVASAGYLDYFAARGVPRERMVVTGIPNFDNCEAFLKNDFPHHDYVLVCSSDTRETVKLDSRERFMGWAKDIARGRPVIVKLHPNENFARAEREYSRVFPDAPILRDGDTDAMIANAEAIVTQYSSTAFVGLALGKEVHSYFDMDELHRLLPEQNRSAARNIAAVCRELVQAPESRDKSATEVAA